MRTHQRKEGEGEQFYPLNLNFSWFFCSDGLISGFLSPALLWFLFTFRNNVKPVCHIHCVEMDKQFSSYLI